MHRLDESSVGCAQCWKMLVLMGSRTICHRVQWRDCMMVREGIVGLAYWRHSFISRRRLHQSTTSPFSFWSDISTGIISVTTIYINHLSWFDTNHTDGKYKLSFFFWRWWIWINSKMGEESTQPATTGFASATPSPFGGGGNQQRPPFQQQPKHQVHLVQPLLLRSNNLFKHNIYLFTLSQNQVHLVPLAPPLQLPQDLHRLNQLQRHSAQHSLLSGLNNNNRHLHLDRATAPSPFGGQQQQQRQLTSAFGSSAFGSTTNTGFGAAPAPSTGGFGSA